MDELVASSYRGLVGANSISALLRIEFRVKAVAKDVFVGVLKESQINVKSSRS